MDVPTQDLRHDWRRLAPAWIREVREGRNANRVGLLDPAMLSACGAVAGLRILDSGCGEGRFCRILAERGAEALVGVDACDAMIAAAQELAGPRERYLVADAEDLGGLEAGSFDLAVSYLNQCDLADHAANTRAVHRLLKPGGRFVVANLHPMRSALGTWQRDAAGDKLHVAVDRYFDESQRRWRMMGCDFTNFHRTLATYVNGFVAAGFVVDGIDEPTASADALRRFPELSDELRVPNFIVYRLRKAGARD